MCEENKKNGGDVMEEKINKIIDTWRPYPWQGRDKRWRVIWDYKEESEGKVCGWPTRDRYAFLFRFADSKVYALRVKEYERWLNDVGGYGENMDAKVEFIIEDSMDKAIDAAKKILGI